MNPLALQTSLQSVLAGRSLYGALNAIGVDGAFPWAADTLSDLIDSGAPAKDVFLFGRAVYSAYPLNRSVALKPDDPRRMELEEMGREIGILDEGEELNLRKFGILQEDSWLLTQTSDDPVRHRLAEKLEATAIQENQRLWLTRLSQTFHHLAGKSRYGIASLHLPASQAVERLREMLDPSLQDTMNDTPCAVRLLDPAFIRLPTTSFAQAYVIRGFPRDFYLYRAVEREYQETGDMEGTLNRFQKKWNDFREGGGYFLLETESPFDVPLIRYWAMNRIGTDTNIRQPGNDLPAAVTVAALIDALRQRGVSYYPMYPIDHLITGFHDLWVEFLKGFPLEAIPFNSLMTAFAHYVRGEFSDEYLHRLKKGEDPQKIIFSAIRRGWAFDDMLSNLLKSENPQETMDAMGQVFIYPETAFDNFESLTEGQKIAIYRFAGFHAGVHFPSFNDFLRYLKSYIGFLGKIRVESLVNDGAFTRMMFRINGDGPRFFDIFSDYFFNWEEMGFSKGWSKTILDAIWKTANTYLSPAYADFYSSLINRKSPEQITAALMLSSAYCGEEETHAIMDSKHPMEEAEAFRSVKMPAWVGIGTVADVEMPWKPFFSLGERLGVYHAVRKVFVDDPINFDVFNVSFKVFLRAFDGKRNSFSINEVVAFIRDKLHGLEKDPRLQFHAFETLMKGTPFETPEISERVRAIFNRRHFAANLAFLRNIDPEGFPENFAAAMEFLEEGIAIRESLFRKYAALRAEERRELMASARARAAEIISGAPIGPLDDLKEAIAVSMALPRPHLSFADLRETLAYAQVSRKGDGPLTVQEAGENADVFSFDVRVNTIFEKGRIDRTHILRWVDVIKPFQNLRGVVRWVKAVLPVQEPERFRQWVAGFGSAEIEDKNVIDFIDHVLTEESRIPPDERTDPNLKRDLLIAWYLHRHAGEISPVFALEDDKRAREHPLALAALADFYSDLSARAEARFQKPFLPDPMDPSAPAYIKGLSPESLTFEQINPFVFKEITSDDPRSLKSFSDLNHAIAWVREKYLALLSGVLKKIPPEKRGDIRFFRARGLLGDDLHEKTVENLVGLITNETVLGFVDAVLGETRFDSPWATHKYELLLIWTWHRFWRKGEKGERGKILVSGETTRESVKAFLEFQNDLYREATRKFQLRFTPKSMLDALDHLRREYAHKVESRPAGKKRIHMIPSRDRLDVMAPDAAENSLVKREAQLHLLNDKRLVPYRIVVEGDLPVPIWEGEVLTYTVPFPIQEKDGKKEALRKYTALVVCGIDPRLEFYPDPEDLLRGLEEGFEKVGRRHEWDWVVTPTIFGMASSRHSTVEKAVVERYPQIITVHGRPLRFPRIGPGVSHKDFYTHDHRQFRVMKDLRRK